MEKIASVLKGAKIGQGVPFLPTSLSDLRNSIRSIDARTR